jgi:uncharacterized membrane protein
VQLYLPKGTYLNGLVGKILGILIAVVFISSFFIYEMRILRSYSLIDLLSIWTIISLALGVYFARTNKIQWHKWTMISMNFLALILTGLFTLMPGSLMHEIFFGYIKFLTHWKYIGTIKIIYPLKLLC